MLPDAPPPSDHALAAYARHAEAVGFSSLWVFDHLLMTPDPRQLDLFATRIKPHLRLRAA